jgi:hypothetical protein
MQAELDGPGMTVEFRVFIDTPRQAWRYYSRRFGIESSYRLSERSIASTTTRNPAVRYSVRTDQLLVTDCLAVSPLGVHGVAPPRRAIPLVVAVLRIRCDGKMRSEDGARGASRRPRE